MRNFQKEEAWMLGPDPGINIIDCGENLSKSIFTRKKLFTIYSNCYFDSK